MPQAGGTKACRVAFRIVAIPTSLWALAVMVLRLTEVVFMWLPRGTLLSVTETLDDGEFDLAHRAHLMSVGIVACPWSSAYSSSFAHPCCSRRQGVHPTRGEKGLGGEEL